MKLPVFDGDGYSVQQRGVTVYPGLYFLGFHWLYTIKFGLFYGIGEGSAYLAPEIMAGT